MPSEPAHARDRRPLCRLRLAGVGRARGHDLRRRLGSRATNTLNPAGSPRRCRRSSPATSSRRTGSGCRRTGTRAPARSEAASSPATSRTTTSRRGTWDTAPSSGSTTTSSAERRSRRGRSLRYAARSHSMERGRCRASDGDAVREGRSGQVHRPSTVELRHRPYDRVTVDDEVVGLPTFSGYSFNERSMLSLAIVDSDVAIGDEVILLRGRRTAAPTARSSSAMGRSRPARS